MQKFSNINFKFSRCLKNIFFSSNNTISFCISERKNVLCIFSATIITSNEKLIVIVVLKFYNWIAVKKRKAPLVLLKLIEVATTLHTYFIPKINALIFSSFFGAFYIFHNTCTSRVPLTYVQSNKFFFRDLNLRGVN